MTNREFVLVVDGIGRPVILQLLGHEDVAALPGVDHDKLVLHVDDHAQVF